MALTTPHLRKSVPSLVGYRAAVVHDFHAPLSLDEDGVEALSASAREHGIEFVGPALD
jgi:hypothetical protein